MVADRRAYGSGLRQREHHRNPKTGHVGPGYWYFTFTTYATPQRPCCWGVAMHPKLVQELLGHSSIAMTLDRYSHWIPSMGEQTAAAMEAALS